VSGPSAASSPAVRRALPPRTFSIVATGDVLVEAGVRLSAATTGARTGRRFDFTDILGRVAPTLRAADLAICHLEIPVGRPGEMAGSFGQTPYGGNRLLAPYEIVPDLASAGIDRCSTASNHSWDLGAEGIATTLLALDEQGISATGTARTPDEAAARAAPFEVSGVRVAHVSYTTRSNAGLPDVPWRSPRHGPPVPRW
jgi:poly-gamma-glutamate capsule biosynthesis protein CapA/YwtB (metallophosphatase superfamily)